MKTTAAVNELHAISAKFFFKASKSNGSLAGDFHTFSSLSYKEFSLHEKIQNWLTLQGYYIVLCDCQTSNMLRIGFLSRVRPFVWREDMRTLIKSTALWQSDSFQLWLYPGSLSCNEKGLMCPVLMVETERDKVEEVLEFFWHAFDGENPLPPCGISHPFFTLYQNQLSVEDRLSIVQDSLHHIGEVSLIHLHGLQDINNLVTLWQSIQVQLRKLLLGLRANQSNHHLFLQVEKEAEPESIVCAYHSVDSAVVMANLPFLLQYICACKGLPLPRLFHHPFNQDNSN
jgi:hypothetical protein